MITCKIIRMKARPLGRFKIVELKIFNIYITLRIISLKVFVHGEASCRAHFQLQLHFFSASKEPSSPFYLNIVSLKSAS